MASGKEHYAYKSSDGKNTYRFEDHQEYMLVNEKWILDQNPRSGLPGYVYFENFTVNKPPEEIVSLNSIALLTPPTRTMLKGPPKLSLN